MSNTVKIYFASDLHLGVPDLNLSLEREKKFVRWLDVAAKDATEIYLVGDIFDMWFEYKKVVPRGFTRLLGKLAEISDKGILLHFFTGNHDMWVFDYFEKELNMKIYRNPVERLINQKRFFIGHGDGLGNGDLGYKFIKKVFASKLNQWLFARLHPNFALGIADYFSRKSRAANWKYDGDFESVEKESLIQYCKTILKNKKVDYFIFGHRHLKMDIPIGENSRYLNLGQWLSGSSYAVFDGSELFLKDFED